MIRISYFFGIVFATTPLPYDNEYTTRHWSTRPYYGDEEWATRSSQQATSRGYETSGQLVRQII